MIFARFINIFLICGIFAVILTEISGCNYLTYEPYARGSESDSVAGPREPNYNVTLDFEYQDFVSYLFMGNRVENFTAYFNTYFKANEDYTDATAEYRASIISFYNKRLDSLGITPAVSGGVKEKLDKAIERASKVIQFNKNSLYLDRAVLLIGKSYYYLGDYYNAERKFTEFLSRLSSSSLTDEAILFLARTRAKILKNEESVQMLKNLLQTSTDSEIRSLAARDLGINAFNSGNFNDAVTYFKESIDFSTDQERKAEGQFILAKILSQYKPELASKEYYKVLDYSSDFDLTFYARLNYAKGLIYNKDFANSTDELESIRKKYRDYPEFAQLVDVEIANNLYGENKILEAKDKYYEVIVKYPNSIAASDAYYFLGRHEEVVEKNYLTALVNYKKAVAENADADYYKDSFDKVAVYEKYFALREEISEDSTDIQIPTTNTSVEKYRQSYNEEKGIEQQNQNNEGTQNPPPPNSGEEGRGGDGKGKPGGVHGNTKITLADSLEQLKEQTGETPNPENTAPNPGNTGTGPNNRGPIKKDEKDGKETVTDTVGTARRNDSLKAVQEVTEKKSKEDKVFNAYFELAELFQYSLDKNDSAEYYLKMLLAKFPDSDKKAKVLYTLGNFYKNDKNDVEADKVFSQVIAEFPNSVYAVESKKILGVKVDSRDLVTGDPIQTIFNKSLDLFTDQKYPEAILELQMVENSYPQDSAVAKSLYSIGWIYENKLHNKDSAVSYYKRLKEKFPTSEYTNRVIATLDYIASVENENMPDSTKQNSVNDSTAVGDTTKQVSQENGESTDEEKKQENVEEVKPDTTAITNPENRLSQEEIDKLLKETEEPPPPQGK